MMKVWVATIAVGDDRNASDSEIVGVFSTADAALDAARAVGPRTAEVEEYELDVAAKWARRP